MTDLTINDLGTLIKDLKTEVEKRFNILPESIQEIVQKNNKSVRREIDIVSNELNAKLDNIFDENLVRDERIDNLERLQLQSDILIHKIPMTTAEDIHSIFHCICEKIKFAFQFLKPSHRFSELNSPTIPNHRSSLNVSQQM